MSDELLTEMIGVEQALMGYEDPDPLTSELLQIEQQFSDDWVYKRAKTARHQENYAERDAAYRRDFPDRPIPGQQQAGRMSMWDLADRYTRQEGDIRVPHPSDLNKIPEEDRPTFLSMVSELAAEKTEGMEERGAFAKLKVRATRAWENWGLNMSQTVRTVLPGLIDKEIAKDTQFKRMATQARRGGDPAKGRTYLGEAFLQAIDMAPAMVGSVPLYYGLGAVAPALGKVGGLAYWTSQIMPQRVDEMVRKGVDPKIAQDAGVVDAMVEAQIEQMNLIMEPGPAASFAGVAAQFVWSYLKEWGEEALQGLTAMGALRIATWLDPKAPEPDWGQEGRDLIKELKQVAVPLGIMMAPGMALGVSGQIRGIPGVQLAQQQRDDLLTPEGAAQWAIKYPMSAEELAEGTRAPSRKVISEMLPNVQMNAKQRAEFARQVKDMFPEVKKFYETWDRAHEFIAEKAQEQPTAEEVEDAVQERGPEEIPVLPEAGVGEQVGAQVRVAEEPAVEGVPPAVEPGYAAEAAARAGEAEARAARDAPEAAGPPRRGLAGYAPEAPGAEAEAEPLPVRRGAQAEEITPEQIKALPDVLKRSRLRKLQPPQIAEDAQAEWGQEQAEDMLLQAAEFAEQHPEHFTAKDVANLNAAANFAGMRKGRKPLAEYAEQAAAEAEARPEAEYLASVLPVPQDRTPLREDEIPAQVQAPRPEVEKRLQNARGIQRTPFLKKAGDVARAAWHRVIRPQAHIPRTAKFASANEFFRLLKDVPNQVLDEVSRMVASIVDPMGPKQLGLFERKLIVDNMAAGLARGEPLRFGFQTAEEVAGYKAQLDELAARSPDIQKALDTRQKIVNSLVGELIDRDMLPKEIADRTDEYFHQQVLGHLQAQRFAISTKARGQKKAFQKRRVKGVDTFGPEFDYNTSYIEAEITWMRDAMTELRKAEHLDKLAGLYDILPQLKKEAKAQERPWEEAVAEMPDYGVWQPQPGNVFYRALSIPDKVVEEIQRQMIDIAEIPANLREVLAMGGPSKQMVLPNPIIEQLQSLEKPKPTGPVAMLSSGAMKTWKVWTLLNPKRALQYNLRNLTGDIDPVLGSAPEALAYIPRAMRELSKYHRGYLKLPADLKDARDLAVISSSLTAEEIPDLKGMKVFRRFYKSKTNIADLPGNYFDMVRNYTEYRENMLRYASYLYYLKQMQAGTLTNYGGSQKSVVDQLMKEQGPKVAAAHLSRNLLGDYGNLSVMGNWMRRHLVPFWSWMEINTKRWPRLFLNAAQAGHLRTLGKTVPQKALFSALAIGQLGIPYAMLWLYNNMVRRDEEEDLARWDQANPHINLGRNEDGSVRVFRNVGAFGDFAEWFGINTLLSLLPLYKSGQITISDILTESAKDPLNKFIGGIRPDLKGMFEILPGQSYFPDVFNPRAIERGEAAAGIFGLQDEWRWVQGVFGRGKRARPNYIQRYFVGVVDPKKNALHEMYDLRERFLAQKGKEAPPLQTISAIRDMREAAIAEDYDAFKEARGVYLEKGKKWSNFKSSLSYLDPISQRLNARDEAEFEHKFLTGTQRLKLGVAREYSQTLKTRLWRWWQEASKEAKK